MVKVLAVVFGLWLVMPLSTPAVAYVENASAQTLLEVCKGSGKWAKNVHWAGFICLSYIRGFVEGHNYTVYVTRSSRLHCIPSSVRAEQVQKVFLKWARDHPEYLHQEAPWALLAALTEAFPCLE